MLISAFRSVIIQLESPLVKHALRIGLETLMWVWDMSLLVYDTVWCRIYTQGWVSTPSPPYRALSYRG